MGLASWKFDTYSGNGSSIHSIDVLSNPFSQAGSGCLVVSFPGTGGTTGYMTAIFPSSPGPSPGFSAGRLRSLFWIENSFTTATISNVYGIFFMADRSASLPSAGASMYLFEYNADTRALRFLRTSTGLSGTPRVLTSTAYSVLQRSVVALQVDWFTDAASIGGTYMKGFAGSSYDYSDLTSVIAYIDTISFLTTASAEGVWGGTRVQNNPSSWTLKVDETYMYISA